MPEETTKTETPDFDEIEEVEEKPVAAAPAGPPPASRVPPSRAPAPSLVVGSSRFPNSGPTARQVPTTMLQGRDGPPPASRVPTTMLQGRDGPPPASRVPTTMLQGRDEPSASSVPTTMLQGRDNDAPLPSLAPSILYSVAPSMVTQSVLITPEDLEFAQKQTLIDDMKGDELKAQEKWAQELIKKTSNCPEGYEFERRNGGYQCGGGGHGISDHLLAEGLGGILACKKRKDGTYHWEDMDGPWYPNPRGKGYVKGAPPKKK